MSKSSSSPSPEVVDLESLIFKQVEQLEELGHRFRWHLLDLGKKLALLREGTEARKIVELPDAQSICMTNHPVEKLHEIWKAQEEKSKGILLLEEERFKVQRVMAENFDSVQRDLARMKSLAEATKEIKEQVIEETKATRDLKDRIEKFKQDLDREFRSLEMTSIINERAINSTLNRFSILEKNAPMGPESWTVIQRRDSASLDNFERDWTDYENGFESSGGSLWLGLKKIHEMTADGSQELRVELTDWDGNFVHANYSQFSVRPAQDFYRLSVSGYSGNAGDALLSQNGAHFSTRDKDRVTGHAYLDQLKGGWWKGAGGANLNGYFYGAKEAKYMQDPSGVFWYAWKNAYYSLHRVTMKIRRMHEII